MRSPAIPSSPAVAAAPDGGRSPHLIDEDDLPSGVTSTEQETEYVGLLAEGFFDDEPFSEDPEPGFWSLAAAVRYGDIPLAS